MVDIPMRSSAPVTRQTVLSINERKVEGAKTTRTITSINHTSSQAVSNASTPASKPLPPLVHMVQKGQKTPLENSGKLTSIKACLGWNVKNPACDVDVSAFLLGSSGKVIGDSWFVFYGQTESPDHSTVFHADGGADGDPGGPQLQPLRGPAGHRPLSPHRTDTGGERVPAGQRRGEREPADEVTRGGRRDA